MHQEDKQMASNLAKTVMVLVSVMVALIALSNFVA